MNQENQFIPYGRQSIDDDDIAAVVDVLRSDWLTTGPKVDEFEKAVCSYVDTDDGVAVNSGTAALHTAMYAIGVGPGDEVIVPTLTFAATANCVLYCSGRPVMVDVKPDTLTIDPQAVERAITPKTKAIIAMDYAGQPCDYQTLRDIADRHNLVLVEDACHAIGAQYQDHKVGSIADLTCFSFHPVKHITTGEGGMTVTNNPDYIKRMRLFRNHGINADQRQRSEQGTWYYEMIDLGFNYRLTDLQCALGIEQLKKLPAWLNRRNDIAAQYNKSFADFACVNPLGIEDDIQHAYHLYVVKIDFERLGKDRKEVFRALRNCGIGVNVHYIPVHMHPYYKVTFNYQPGDFPVAQAAYQQILSLPMYAGMSDDQVKRVIDCCREIMSDE